MAKTVLDVLKKEKIEADKDLCTTISRWWGS